MKQTQRWSGTILLAAIVICGCTSQLVKQGANGFARTGNDATAAASELYSNLVKASTDTVDLIAAIDPNCPTEFPLISKSGDAPVAPKYKASLYDSGADLYDTLHASPKFASTSCAPYRSAVAAHCSARCKPGENGCSACVGAHTEISGLICLSENARACADATGTAEPLTPYDPAPFDLRTFKPETDAIGVVNEYLKVLAQLSESDAPQIGDTLESGAKELSDTAAALGLEKTVPDLTDKASAVGTLADLLIRIGKDASDAKAIRATVNREQNAISEQLEFIAQRSDKDYCETYGSAVRAQRDALSIALRHATVADPRSFRYRARLIEMLRTSTAVVNEVTTSCKSDKRNSPAGRLLRAADEAQKELVKLVNGRLTPEQRNQAVLAALRNFRDVVAKVVALAKIFA